MPDLPEKEGRVMEMAASAKCCHRLVICVVVWEGQDRHLTLRAILMLC
ncbi:MAG TPA: hypothetical protein VN379_23820 [Sporomusa sp.]|jgi:hypothetical protein|nr:hypothetical protein [Sporomusa sp.]